MEAFLKNVSSILLLLMLFEFSKILQTTLVLYSILEHFELCTICFPFMSLRCNPGLKCRCSRESLRAVPHSESVSQNLLVIVFIFLLYIAFSGYTLQVFIS